MTISNNGQFSEYWGKLFLLLGLVGAIGLNKSLNKMVSFYARGFQNSLYLQAPLELLHKLWVQEVQLSQEAEPAIQ